MSTYLTMALIGLVVSSILSPVAKRLGPRLRAIDMPNPLTIHAGPTPRTGGLAILAGFLMAVSFAAVITRAHTPMLLGVLPPAGIVALVGFLGDRGTMPTKVEVWALAAREVSAALRLQTQTGGRDDAGREGS